MYSHGQRSHMMAAAAATTATGVIAATRTFPIMRPIGVIGIAATITTVPTVAAAVANFKYRPTPGSATGEVSLGTLTLPTTAAIGQQYYKKIAPFKALPGGELVVDITTASTAGAASFGYVEDSSAEHSSNVAAMIASA